MEHNKGYGLLHGEASKAGPEDFSGFLKEKMSKKNFSFLQQCDFEYVRFEKVKPYTTTFHQLVKG